MSVFNITCPLVSPSTAKATNCSNVMKLAFHPSTNATILLTVILAKTKRAARIRRRWDVLPISLNATAADVSALLTSVTENTTATINLTYFRLIALKTNLFAPTCAPVIIYPAT